MIHVYRAIALGMARRTCRELGHDWPEEAPEPCRRCGLERQPGVRLGKACCSYHGHGGATGEACRPWPRDPCSSCDGLGFVPSGRTFADCQACSTIGSSEDRTIP